MQAALKRYKDTKITFSFPEAIKGKSFNLRGGSKPRDELEGRVHYFGLVKQFNW